MISASRLGLFALPLTLTALALLLFGILSARGAGAAGAGVSLQSTTFQPRVVTITKNAAVTWSHRDSISHTVTAVDGAWDSGVLEFGGSFSRSFADEGRFAYFCRVHPSVMTGTVVVAGDPPPPNVVAIQGFAFDPDAITVTTGTTVTWTNLDDDRHSSNAVAGLWDSPILRRGESYGRRFDQPGTYEYLCGLHPEMKGEVVVTRGAASTPTATTTPALTPTATARTGTATATAPPAAKVYLPLITRSWATGW